MSSSPNGDDCVGASEISLLPPGGRRDGDLRAPYRADHIVSGRRSDRQPVHWPDGFIVTIYDQNGNEIGQTAFTLIEDIQLNPGSRNFTEKIWVYYVKSTGTAPVWDMAFFSFCDSPCAATDHFPEGAPLEVGIGGYVSFRDGIGPGRIQTDRASEDLTISATDFTPVSWPWQTPLPFRCDDDLTPEPWAARRQRRARLIRRGVSFPSRSPRSTCQSPSTAPRRR